MLTRWLPDRVRALIGAAMVLVAALIGLIVHWRLIVWGDSGVLEEFIEHRGPVFTTLMTIATTAFNPFSAIVVSFALGGLMWWLNGHWRHGAYVVGTVAVASLITITLKTIYRRGRPPELDRLITETDFSFPSGHTTAATALMAALAIAVCWRELTLRRELLVWLLAVAVAGTVAASRLYLGVHWFTDVSAGALVGAGTALALSALIPDAGPAVPGTRADAG